MNKDALQLATKNLAIKMVYLESTETKLYNGFDPLVPDQQLIGQFRIETESHEITTVKESERSYRFIRYHVKAEMRYLKGPLSAEIEESKALEVIASEIKASFVAEYAIIDNVEISDESMREFGRVNARFNVWPYWREYCQSTCSRMALPVIVIPMLTIE